MGRVLQWTEIELVVTYVVYVVFAFFGDFMVQLLQICYPTTLLSSG